jgi:3-hydroxyacyl-[acyl-carrier-protein] dehydratase
VTATSARPVLVRPIVLDRTMTDDTATASTVCHITEDEPVFEGHYPDFPIFPGVCVVECVRASADTTAPSGHLRLSAVESMRFSGPVFPGDELAVELKWRSSGLDWLCTAVASTTRGRAASVRLRYQNERDGKLA